jgi:putative FmdB family regulatory protein
MPTYEYRCPNGHDFDHLFRKMSEGKASWPCPICGLPGERRMSVGAGLVFKGSGFYITDYGKDGKKDQRTAGTSEAKPASAPASGSDGAAAPTAGGGSTTSGPPSSAPSSAPSSTPSSPSSASGSDGSKPSGEAKKSGIAKPE